jgi:hypothetical protein
MAKTRKEVEAAKKLEIAVLKAQEDISEGAKTARKKIDDAADAAVAALEVSSRVPDKRNLDGSFQWDRGDRYRRGSDEKLQRLEDKINGERNQISTLEVGQARREEQIAGLINDCADLDGLIIGLKTGHESVERDLKIQIDEIRMEMNNTEKEFTSRAVTQRELLLTIKESFAKELADYRDGFAKELSDYKTRNLWQTILFLLAIVTAFAINKFIQI